FQPASSVEFVGFALEELGLIGSSQYAQQAHAAGVDVIGMISLEMIAYTCFTPGCQVAIDDIPGCLDVEPEGVNVGTFIAGVSNVASAPLLARFVEAQTTYVPSLPIVTGEVAGAGLCFPDTRRSDHAPFWDLGYRALMLSDTANLRNPYYHTPNDTSDTLDFGFARLVTQGALATVVLEVGCACPCDCEDPPDGGVDVGDFLALLAQWGTADTCDCEDPPDGAVDVGDFLALLAAWGDCP
ncbi:MAG: M28 family peptidase, partial [Planctomycetota bacterium]